MSSKTILSLFLVSCVVLSGVGAADCPSGEVGDKRIQCADPDISCVCTLIGDPHLTQYPGKTSTLFLPCVHLISQYKLNDLSSCDVRVEGGAHTSHSQSLATREEMVEVLASSVFDHYFTRIVKGKLTEEDNSGFSLSSVTTTMDNVTVVTIPECGLVVKFDSNNGFLAIVGDVNTYEALSAVEPGLCGNCEHPRSTAEFDHFDALQLELNSLITLSSFDGKNLNEYGGCQDIGQATSTCQHKEAAVRICGSMLVRPAIRDCMLVSLRGSFMLLEYFRVCYTGSCRVPLMPCTFYTSHFPRCDTSEIDELKDPAFCIQGR